MNKELQIRRRIQNIYNKRQEDFPTLRAYNDYLEEVEDIIFNLIEGVDVAATEEKLMKYQDENAEAIIASRARRAEEEASFLRSGQSFGAADGAPAGIDPQVQQSAAPAAAAAAPGKYAPTFLPPRPAAQQPVPVGPPSYNANGEPEDENTKRLREDRGLRAGGWTIDITRRRAYEEAIMSIWVS
jgi:CDK-activating kinase assembly factor MAT1